MAIEAQIELISCPNCDIKGPKTKYCLNCGNEKFPNSEDSTPENVVVVEETSNKLEENLKKTEEVTKEDKRDEKNDKTPLKNSQKKIKPPKSTRARRQSAIKTNTSHVEIELDPIVKDNISNLKMTIDLILWLVDLYIKGNVEEENFNSLFDSYEYRLNQCLKRRDQMLESASDLEPLQKSLNKAMLQLSELEQKKIIGNISDEEYELKAPVFRWDINKYEREIAKSKSEISALEDLTQIITDEEMSDLKSTAENAKVTIGELQKSGKVSQETAARIIRAMDNTLTVYMNTPKK